jgi:hypothetical protein
MVCNRTAFLTTAGIIKHPLFTIMSFITKGKVADDKYSTAVSSLTGFKVVTEISGSFLPHNLHRNFLR